MIDVHGVYLSDEQAAAFADAKLRLEAIEILAIVASQPTWEFGCRTVPGTREQARELANSALAHPACRDTLRPSDGEDYWRYGYLEAEALLREGWSP